MWITQSKYGVFMVVVSTLGWSALFCQVINSLFLQYSQCYSYIMNCQTGPLSYRYHHIGRKFDTQQDFDPEFTVNCFT